MVENQLLVITRMDALKDELKQSQDEVKRLQDLLDANAQSAPTATDRSDRSRPFHDQPKIPNFSGRSHENARSWMEKLELILEQEDDSSAAKQFRLRLDGPAEDWVRDLDKEVKESFSKLREAFTGKYITCGSDFWMVHETIKNKRQGECESVDQYLTSLQYYWAKVERSERDRLTDFVGGLLTDLRVEVIRCDCTILEEAIKTAVRAEQIRAIQAKDRPPSVNSVTDLVAVMREELRALKADHTWRPRQDSKAPAPSSGDRQDDRTSDGRPICTYCDKLGHSTQVCRKRLGQCFKCGKPGHIRFDCPN
jgi:hypothetical protein